MWDAELRGRVAILTYTRPPENVLGFADLAQLDATLQRWGSDERARVIVLTGGIPGYFAAHADLADVGALVHGSTAGPHGPQAWGRALTRISAIPQPVIAVEAVLPSEGFLEAVLDWAAPLASQPRHSLAAAKQALLLSAQTSLDQGLIAEQDIFRAVLTSPPTKAQQSGPLYRRKPWLLIGADA